MILYVYFTFVLWLQYDYILNYVIILNSNLRQLCVYGNLSQKYSIHLISGSLYRHLKPQELRGISPYIGFIYDILFLQVLNQSSIQE